MATAAEIAAAVQALLAKGDAQRVCSLAWIKQNRLPLIQNDGVIAKLVELVCHGTGRQDRALGALLKFVEGGDVAATTAAAPVVAMAQDAIGNAHGGAIFTRLGGRSAAESDRDDDKANRKQQLLHYLIANHPVNRVKLVLAKGGGVDALLKLIAICVTSDDSAVVAAAMDALDQVANPQELAMFCQLGGVDVLLSVINWERPQEEVEDGTLAHAQDYAWATLIKYVGVEPAEGLIEQSQSMLLLELQQDAMGSTLGAAQKLQALRGLHQIAQHTTDAQEIVHDGGIATLVAILNSYALLEKEQVGRAIVMGLWVFASRILATLAHINSSVRAQIVRDKAIAPLYRLCRRSQSHVCKTAAMNALRGLLQDQHHAELIADMCGIPFLIQLLRDDRSKRTSYEIPVLAILESQLLTNGANVIAFASCDGAIALLVKLATNDDDLETRDRACRLLRRLPRLIPLLLRTLAKKERGKCEEKLAGIHALEILSSDPVNQTAFTEAGGVERMVALLEESTGYSDDDIKAMVARAVQIEMAEDEEAVPSSVVQPAKNNDDEKIMAVASRILANLVKDNETNCKAAATCGALPLLKELLESTASSEELKTAVMMALRDLATDPDNCAVIGALGVIPYLIDLMAESQTTTEQREIAVAVLGNLGRLPANQTKIVFHGGVSVRPE